MVSASGKIESHWSAEKNSQGAPILGSAPTSVCQPRYNAKELMIMMGPSVRR
jgi:hypothetical protein